jgi:phosphohistidine phosphatase SixA
LCGLAVAAAIALCLTSALAAVPPVDAAAWAALRDGGIVLFRHAHAPDGGDPAGFKLGDCTTQRNLDATGRAQARRIGDRLRQERIRVGAVLSSQWCRARETAELMALGPVHEVPAFNSFFDDRSQEPAQTAAVRSLLLGWRGSGALVVATHHVNIMALTGIAPQPGEGIVLRRRDGQLVVVGRISP